MNNISEKISTLRKVHNMTQEALGEAVGVTAQAVSKWEKGDSLPDITVLPDLCKVFGISADFLIGSTGNVSAEQYLEKAIEAYKDHQVTDILKDIFNKLVNKNIKNITQGAGEGPLPRLDSELSNKQHIIIADGRGFGAYIAGFDYIKRIASFNFAKSEIINLLVNESIMNLFSLIVVNGALDENELSQQLNISIDETEVIIFKLLKNNLIQVCNKNGLKQYNLGEFAIYLLCGLSAISLCDPTSREGLKGSGYSFNYPPDK